jgi:uncharacterized protein YjgD (DUF1641 family)
MENILKELIDLITENVLDRMRKQKISNNIRRNSIAGQVYSEFPSEREKEVIKQVSANLNKIPYSHNPPMMGLTKNRKIKHTE